MLKKNWKNLFRKTILNRGYGCYLEGAVEDISREDDVISAAVCGTDLYEVEIFLNHDEVYELEDTDITEKSSVKESIADLINAADEATVRTFLADVLENDEKLKQRFLLLTDKPKAIVIYEDLIEPDLGYRGSVTGYREELLRLYRKTGNTEKALEMPWDLVCKSKSHEYYNELKTNHGGLAHTL